ncbi:MAG TPA: SMEK domain-containing protein [Gemmataceae bacterium]|jgi:hypothetical protein
MAFQRTEYLGVITDSLAYIASVCELRGVIKLFDDHIVAEHFFRRVLNCAYDLQLQNMEEIRSNHPAIDLGDSTKRIAYQITADHSNDKVKHTLDTFVKHEQHKLYDSLRILIIGERKPTYRAVTIPPELTFNTDRDILGTKELLQDIAKLENTKLEELRTILDEELSWPGKRKPISKYRPIADVELRHGLTDGERVALLALTEEFGCQVRTNTRVPMGNGWVLFDAAVVTGHTLVGIEIFDYKGGGFPHSQVNHLINIVSNCTFDRFREFSLRVVVVSDADPAADDTVKAQLAATRAKATFDVQIMWYRLNELRVKYNI